MGAAFERPELMCAIEGWSRIVDRVSADGMGTDTGEWTKR
jgi:hypothetical protein